MFALVSRSLIVDDVILSSRMTKKHFLILSLNILSLIYNNKTWFECVQFKVY